MSDNFMSFEEFSSIALTYERLEELANRDEGVIFYRVYGLAHESFMYKAITNKNMFHNYEPSDLGRQFAYIDDGHERSGFSRDAGLEQSRHNQHLVFLNHSDALNYLHCQKGSRPLMEKRMKEKARWATIFKSWDFEDYEDYGDSED